MKLGTKVLLCVLLATGATTASAKTAVTLVDLEKAQLELESKSWAAHSLQKNIKKVLETNDFQPSKLCFALGKMTSDIFQLRFKAGEMSVAGNYGRNALRPDDISRLHYAVEVNFDPPGSSAEQIVDSLSKDICEDGKQVEAAEIAEQLSLLRDRIQEAKGIIDAMEVANRQSILAIQLELQKARK